ncbi:unnamed protein product [Euphydryas editha]|uniref:Uncharacterized protein n=1 Tax=Euphydryas editha TaxID=104508 RepID=A0AAU9UZ78_EUPED|nr:unnamed protein product [Euphydryas editha]
MFFKRVLILNVILALGINTHISCYQYDESYNKILLNADELSNIVHNKEILKKRTKVHTNLPTTISNILSSKDVTRIEVKNDDLMLRLRKIWSRWGKWSECSVTCGDGIISRRRLCVSGRCAPGEFEEQRRPCNRPPCDCYTVDDLRDTD